MKLVIGGSTGFVAKELIRQGLKNPAITSIIARGRREAPTPSEAGNSASKFNSIVVEDFENYSESVKKEIENADARYSATIIDYRASIFTIRTIAVTATKLKEIPFEQTVKISRDYATYAIKALDGLRNKQATHLRFIYMSGHFAPRSLAEVPQQLKTHGTVDAGLLRGEAEGLILKYGRESNGTVQSCVIKPGAIDHLSREKKETPGLPHIKLDDIAAALLDQTIHGFEKDTLTNDDMIRIGQKVLSGDQES
ncbi:hypothetical protein HYALB_00011247 [Hymenoscyphus albidus]|uniref:NAD(P)-binding domain-containing protein n=1 Tax=Hymenoscyphus albidus TaxID=595503 RepID=A0A9N9PYT6_9HELO|nr:hypothetical protein HYALB_00011247 [Hymenoscyphus albidus]